MARLVVCSHEKKDFCSIKGRKRIKQVGIDNCTEIKEEMFNVSLESPHCKCWLVSSSKHTRRKLANKKIFQNQ